VITREFVEAEIASLEAERQKAINFQIKAEGALEAYRVILGKLEEVGGDGTGSD